MPESDHDSPSKHGGFAALNNMSERQTRKLQAGNFGMFNRPILMPKAPPGTPESGTKRKRAKEYSDYIEPPRSQRRTQQVRSDDEVIVLDNEGKDGQTLFIPESTTLTPLGADESEDERTLYASMPPDRARNAQAYLDVIASVESADSRLQVAKSELAAMTTEHTTLEWKLANLDAAAENGISEILRERDEAIRIANLHAEEKIQMISERLPGEKNGCEMELRDVARRQKDVEEKVLQVETELETVEERQRHLERVGGFELCSDVREVQGRRLERR